MNINLKLIIIAMTMFTASALSTAAQCQWSEALQWTLGRQWSNGFKALPDMCVNLMEFQSQYEKNQAQWDAMFQWLATHDLTAMPAGKHPIEGTEMVVSIEDTKNQPLEKRKSESHYNHIDFQYVVKGTEGFGLLDHDSSKPNCEWKPDVIHYDYDPTKTMIVDSTPERFFLFFPNDWHIAKIAPANGCEDLRVIVVKLNYIE